MNIDVRAPRGGDMRDVVKKLTLKADDGRDDEMEFLKNLSNIWQDGGVILLYSSDALVGKKRRAIIGEVQPTFAWSSRMTTEKKD